MPRYLPLLLTILIFLIVAATQLWFIVNHASISYLIVGAILLFLGAMATAIQVNLFVRRRDQ